MAAKTAHLAPDFDKRAHFNTVRVKPEYRISLKMGSIEDLFVNAPGTLEGRMERLQVLGLFYFPLEHKKAKDRFPETWKWFKEKIAKAADDAAADKTVQDALKSRVVSGAKPPGWNDAPTGLPVDAADPMNPAAENFAKIRIPGGYTVQTGAGAKSINEHAKYQAQFSTNRLFQHETHFYTENRVLGKIPLVAFVEKRLTAEDPWVPAKDASVHFQLLPTYPDDKPAFDPAAKSSEQFARPPLGALRGVPFSWRLPNPPPTPLPANYPMASTAGGPKKKIDAEEAHSHTGDTSITGADRFKPENAHKVDPQGKNAHKTRGGKRGEGSLTDCSDVAGHVFSTTSMDGFNADGPRKPPHKPYPLAVKAVPSAHKHVHAVRAKTNEDGEAGVLFMPSRCGGDRYRIRAYIGPPTTPSHGAEVGATQVTTGTFIVWRNLRVSRLIRHEVGATPDPRLVANVSGAPYNISTATAYLRKSFSHDGSSHVGLSDVRLDDPDASPPDIYASLPLHFAPAFLEVEFDAAGPETLTSAEWKSARKQGVDDAKAGLTDLSLNLDLDALYFTDLDFAADATSCVMTMRSPESYNAMVPAGKKLAFTGTTLQNGARDDVKNLTENYALNGFMRAITKDGSLPGLTLVYSGMGYTWQFLVIGSYSGRVQDYRGSYLWFGDDVYATNWIYSTGMFFSYDCSSNACHELGHAMFQRHGVAALPGNAPPDGAKSQRHDPETDCYCVMSYGMSNGQYCGLTLLSFRGWDVPQPPA